MLVNVFGILLNPDHVVRVEENTMGDSKDFRTEVKAYGVNNCLIGYWSKMSAVEIVYALNHPSEDDETGIQRDLDLESHI